MKAGLQNVFRGIKVGVDMRGGKAPKEIDWDVSCETKQMTGNNAPEETRFFDVPRYGWSVLTCFYLPSNAPLMWLHFQVLG